MVAPLVSTLNPIWRSIIVPFAPFKLCLNIVCGGNFFPLAPPPQKTVCTLQLHTHTYFTRHAESLGGVGGWVGGGVGVGGCGAGWLGKLTL